MRQRIGGLFCGPASVLVLLGACAPAQSADISAGAPAGTIQTILHYEQELRSEGGCAPLVWMDEIEPVAARMLLDAPGDSLRSIVPGRELRNRLLARGVDHVEAITMRGSMPGGVQTFRTWLGGVNNRAIIKTCRFTHTAVATSGDQWLQILVER